MGNALLPSLSTSWQDSHANNVSKLGFNKTPYYINNFDILKLFWVITPTN